MRSTITYRPVHPNRDQLTQPHHSIAVRPAAGGLAFNFGRIVPAPPTGASADQDGVIYEGGAGARIAGESDDPVTTSTVFHIMSMTKIVATTAALQQMERGELDLDAPVDSYCPQFADVRVLDGFDGDTPRLR